MRPSSTTGRNRNKKQTETLDRERCLCCPNKALIEKSALRQHLTDMHAKALAKALLMPDPNSVEEQWLHRIAFESIEADNCAEATENDQRKANKVKLNGNSQVSTTIETVSPTLNNKRTRRPSLVVRESINNPENGHMTRTRGRPKKEETTIATNKEERSDAEDQAPPSSSPSKPSTTIKSSQLNTTCRQCGAETERRANHVLVKHMNAPMYECPLCRFSSNYFERAVVEHINTVHKSHDNLVPLDNRRRYSKVFQQLLDECFGSDGDVAVSRSASETTSSPRNSEEKFEEREYDESENSPSLRRSRRRIVKRDGSEENATAEKKTKRCSEPDDSDSTGRRSATKSSPKRRHREDLDDVAANPVSTSFQPHPMATRKTYPKKRHEEDLDDDDDDDVIPAKKSSRVSTSYQQQPWAPNRPPPKIAGSRVDLTDPEVCHICHHSVPLMRKRHVLQYHFPVAVYECSACEFVSYAQPSVHKHVESAHEGADPSVVAVSHLADMAGQIADMQRKCFPLQAIRRVFKTRRKSLFKFSTVTATDGRELVYCKLCDDGIKEKAFRHVLEHLDQPVYACRYCAETSPTDLTNIRKHSQRSHPEETDQEPLVRIADYQADIDALYEQCFEKVPRQEHERLFKRKVPAKRPRKPKTATDWQT